MDNIILTGMPGSGKTTIGRAVAEKLGYEFFDLDDLIEEKTKRTIEEIFKTGGEEEFRIFETSMLVWILSKGYKSIVLSTGGGTVKNSVNRILLKKIGKVFYLEVPVDKIYERIKGDSKRPLLQKDNPKEVLSGLYAERRAAYAEADFKIDASCGVERVLDEIYEKIKG